MLIAPEPAQPASRPLPAASAIRLLPDLRTLQPTDIEVRRFASGRRILRLANTVYNSGQGPLELVGQFNRLTQRTQVYQRIYAPDGPPLDWYVGEFVWHFGHTHWHFEDFALYQLWQLTPAGERQWVVASSAKLSYCLIDTDIIEDHAGVNPRRQYFGCGRQLQGLSVGWGDKYDSFLDGQSLDITGLADGVYALVSTANPWSNIVESDYDNNATAVYLDISDDKAAIVPSPELSACSDGGRC
jgi:hypothetical protein